VVGNRVLAGLLVGSGAQCGRDAVKTDGTLAILGTEGR
jgi:hypothetical protein